MAKKIIKLTEGDLNKIIKESVNNILNEIGDTERGQYALGALQARHEKQMKDAYDKNDYDLARKHSHMADQVDKKSFEHTYIGDNDYGYDKRKDLYNAKLRGLRNYRSYMNNPDAEDYRTAPQTKADVEKTRMNRIRMNNKNMGW